MVTTVDEKGERQNCGGPRVSSEVVAAALGAPNTGERGARERAGSFRLSEWCSWFTTIVLVVADGQERVYRIKEKMFKNLEQRRSYQYRE